MHTLQLKKILATKNNIVAFLTCGLWCLLCFSVQAQDFETLEEDSDGNVINTSKEGNERAELPGELTNKGLFLTTYFSAGYNRRNSNGNLINSKPGAAGANFGTALEIGVARNFRVGPVFERAGFWTRAGDSLKIYSLNYGLNFHFRVVNEEKKFYYARIGAGLSSLQVFDIFIVTNQDSILLASNKGGFLNMEFGVEQRYNPKITYFYGVKTGMMFYPEMVRINIYSPANPAIVYMNEGLPSQNRYKVNFKQLLFVFGISFKL